MFFSPPHPQRWIFAVLLAGYLILLLTEPRVRRLVKHYPHFYLGAQTFIIVALLLIPLESTVSADFLALLFLPLCFQCFLSLPRKISYGWIGVFLVAIYFSFVIANGFLDGLQYILTYALSSVMMGFVAVILIDAEKARADLQVAHEQLQTYAATAEELAVAEERNRLARDLHDSVTQALYSQTLFAEAAARELSVGETETAAEHLEELGKTARLALQEMRLMIFELRPPILEKEGLTAALRERLEAVEARAGIRTSLSSSSANRLPAEVEIGFYGIAREALNNILKHAHATEVGISVSQTEQVVLMEVVDNGVGFDPDLVSNGAGFGLTGMRERATQMGADLKVDSRPEKGTTIRVEAPSV